jgi:hypothetical protein
MRLIDNWRLEIGRLWSMRLAIGSAVLWSGVGGFLLVWPALADKIPLPTYILGGLVLSVLFGVARLLKQPGAE